MTTAASSDTWKAEPFHFKAPPQFAALRDLLRRAGYTHDALCERLGIGSVYEFKEVRDGQPLLPEILDPLSLCVRLFLDAEEVSWSEVRRVLSAEDISLLESFGLVEQGQTPEHCVSTVLLYPIEQLWIVSDRSGSGTSSDSASKPPADVVYPAMTRNTQRFIGLMPRATCDRFLELCA